MDTFSQMDQRLYDTPLVTFGVPVDVESPSSTVIYDGRLLPNFLHTSGASHTASRQFLINNRIGSIYDLESGQIVTIPVATNSLSSHQEA